MEGLPSSAMILLGCYIMLVWSQIILVMGRKKKAKGPEACATMVHSGDSQSGQSLGEPLSNAPYPDMLDAGAKNKKHKKKGRKLHVRPETTAASNPLQRATDRNESSTIVSNLESTMGGLAAEQQVETLDEAGGNTA